MTARNDITGDSIMTKTSTDAYSEGWDRIFGKKPVPAAEPEPALDPEAFKRAVESSDVVAESVCICPHPCKWCALEQVTRS